MKKLRVVLSVVVVVMAISFLLTISGLTGAQQIPGLPKLPGGLSIPGVPSGKIGFAGLDALSVAKDLYGQKEKPIYPTPNIAVSGNHIVIAWPSGVVTVETISEKGTLHRTVLGPPTDRNIF
ncbi:MAG TPA: hypothetical protein VN328_07805 [Thermodesulfovibrionales bacterium]|nr:hypothetical protein [Thermodesulfovibrionales bacterium]